MCSSDLTEDWRRGARRWHRRYSKSTEGDLGIAAANGVGLQRHRAGEVSINAGEVHGISNSLESFRSTWRAELDKGEVTYLVQANLKPHPDIPNVPWAADLTKSDEARKMILTTARVSGVLNRFYVLPPGTAKDRVLLLRKAFMETMKDPEFVADAQKAKLDLDPIDGEEIQKQVRELFKIEPALVAKLKEILK